MNEMSPVARPTFRCLNFVSSAFSSEIMAVLVFVLVSFLPTDMFGECNVYFYNVS